MNLKGVSLEGMAIENSKGESISAHDAEVVLATYLQRHQGADGARVTIVPVIGMDAVDAPKAMKERIDAAAPAIGFALLATTGLFGALIHSAVKVGGDAVFFVLAAFVINGYALFRGVQLGRTLLLFREALDRSVSLPAQVAPAVKELDT